MFCIMSFNLDVPDVFIKVRGSHGCWEENNKVKHYSRHISSGEHALNRTDCCKSSPGQGDIRQASALAFKLFPFFSICTSLEASF